MRMTKLAGIDRAATQADQAYEALLAEILDCRLAPGAKITISDVAARLQMSPGAVREALSRLSAEKWTIAAAQKGYSVAPVSIADLKDLTRTRIAIEQMCLRSAIAHGDVEWETSIVAAYHRLHRIPIVVADTASRLNDGLGRRTHHLSRRAGVWLRQPMAAQFARRMLYAQSERYRHLSFALGRENRDVDAEHKAILDACLARDAELACRLIDDHLKRTTDILVSSPPLRDAQRQGVLQDQ